jgi:hypothetical protein
MENQRQYIILGALFAVLIGVLVWQFVLRPSEAPTPAPPSAGAKPSSGAKTSEAPQSPPRIEKVDINIDDLLANVQVVSFDYAMNRIERDPLAPLVGRLRPGLNEPIGNTSQAMEVLRKSVTGIVYDEHDPVAVVDNTVVHVGYVFPNGVEVHAIEPTRVIFKVGDALIPVEMKEL